jgi:hypothetical protein
MAAADLQAGCQLAGLDREVTREDGEALDRLVAREMPVGLVDGGLEKVVDLRVPREPLELGGQAALGCPGMIASGSRVNNAVQ